MKSSPFAARLFELQITPHSEATEELAFLEDWMAWKVEGGVARVEKALAAARLLQYRQDYELRRELGRQAVRIVPHQPK